MTNYLAGNLKNVFALQNSDDKQRDIPYLSHQGCTSLIPITNTVLECHAFEINSTLWIFTDTFVSRSEVLMFLVHRLIFQPEIQDSSSRDIHSRISCRFCEVSDCLCKSSCVRVGLKPNPWP